MINEWISKRSRDVAGKFEMLPRDGRTKPNGRIESSRNFTKTPYVETVRVHRIPSVDVSVDADN